MFPPQLLDCACSSSTSGVEAKATIESEVSDVLSVAGAAGDWVLVVGHSSGAVVALEAALVSPSLFAGLVLYEPPVAVAKRLFARMRR